MFPFQQGNPLAELLGNFANPTGSTAGTPVVPAVAPEVNRLAQLRQDISAVSFDPMQEEPEATKAQKILAAIKDGLLAYSAGLQGRGYGEGAQDRIRQTKERNAAIRERNARGQDAASAESRRRMAELEYEDLVRADKEKLAGAERTRAELSKAREEASELGIDPGDMGTSQLRSAVAKRKADLPRIKEGVELMDKLVEYGLQVDQDQVAALRAGDARALAAARSALTSEGPLREQEKRDYEERLRTISNAPKGDGEDKVAARDLAKEREKQHTRGVNISLAFKKGMPKSEEGEAILSASERAKAKVPFKAVWEDFQDMLDAEGVRDPEARKAAEDHFWKQVYPSYNRTVSVQ